MSFFLVIMAFLFGHEIGELKERVLSLESVIAGENNGDLNGFKVRSHETNKN